jgi:hypothetical protein
MPHNLSNFGRQKPEFVMSSVARHLAGNRQDLSVAGKRSFEVTIGSFPEASRLVSVIFLAIMLSSTKNDVVQSQQTA